MLIYLKRLFFKIIKMTPAKMEMVQYWKRQGTVAAKVMEVDGVTVMQMEGEKYQFPGFPRGHLLHGTGGEEYGKLSVLKHQIKNKIFNDSWALLEEGKPISDHIDSVMPEILALWDDNKYDMVPPQKMVPSVKEIHRAWTKVAPSSYKLRDLVTYILQEDDAYRFRLQWMVPFMGWFGSPTAKFDRALGWTEHGEVIGDMKERVRLFRRVIIAIISNNPTFWNALYKEVDWNKVKMTKADKYFFRGKYFKVDLDKFDY